MTSFIPVACVMLAIFLMSHTPGDALPQMVNGLDKVIHTLTYTALGLTALFARRKQYAKNPQKTGLTVILFCLGYGISDEFHQAFIPGRTPSLLDLVADLCGGLLACLIWFLWSRSPRT